ncbi:hypothetical protein HELRODRAFT_173282 [Helobdella robusta]|uniref:G-protein coupled receptors family 1 profile domain-containing protein n=1 Tax=Helobdella robusta TaxID=6412 RepID=T1F6M7_HELRO|nr:hypothetical protein HELRODRAFT_173282 [Helobdella robusta]ESO03578.1 hypothetical protein HELRODRAFT_173282 [Helobdella robusta]
MDVYINSSNTSIKRTLATNTANYNSNNNDNNASSNNNSNITDIYSLNFISNYLSPAKLIIESTLTLISLIINGYILTASSRITRSDRLTCLRRQSLYTILFINLTAVNFISTIFMWCSNNLFMLSLLLSWLPISIENLGFCKFMGVLMFISICSVIINIAATVIIFGFSLVQCVAISLPLRQLTLLRKRNVSGFLLVCWGGVFIGWLVVLGVLMVVFVEGDGASDEGNPADDGLKLGGVDDLWFQVQTLNNSKPYKLINFSNYSTHRNDNNSTFPDSNAFSCHSYSSKVFIASFITCVAFITVFYCLSVCLLLTTFYQIRTVGRRMASSRQTPLSNSNVSDKPIRNSIQNSIRDPIRDTVRNTTQHSVQNQIQDPINQLTEAGTIVGIIKKDRGNYCWKCSRNNNTSGSSSNCCSSSNFNHQNIGSSSSNNNNDNNNKIESVDTNLFASCEHTQGHKLRVSFNLESDGKINKRKYTCVCGCCSDKNGISNSICCISSCICDISNFCPCINSERGRSEHSKRIRNKRTRCRSGRQRCCDYKSVSKPCSCIKSANSCNNLSSSGCGSSSSSSSGSSSSRRRSSRVGGNDDDIDRAQANDSSIHINNRTDDVNVISTTTSTTTTSTATSTTTTSTITSTSTMTSKKIQILHTTSSASNFMSDLHPMTHVLSGQRDKIFSINDGEKKSNPMKQNAEKISSAVQTNARSTNFNRKTKTSETVPKVVSKTTTLPLFGAKKQTTTKLSYTTTTKLKHPTTTTATVTTTSTTKPTTATTTTSVPSTTLNATTRNDKKAFITIMALTTILTIYFLPMLALNIHSIHHTDSEDSTTLFYLITILAYSKYIVDPIVYGSRMPELNYLVEYLKVLKNRILSIFCWSCS